jgi:hypothetical protein
MQQVNDLVHWHGIKCQNGPPSAAAILGEARGCLSTASFHAYPKRLERRAKLSGWLFRDFLLAAQKKVHPQAARNTALIRPVPCGCTLTHPSPG